MATDETSTVDQIKYGFRTMTCNLDRKRYPGLIKRKISLSLLHDIKHTRQWIFSNTSEYYQEKFNIEFTDFI